MKELALVFVEKNHSEINDFFQLISRLLNLIGSSYKRWDMLREKQSTIVTQQNIGIKVGGRGIFKRCFCEKCNFEILSMEAPYYNGLSCHKDSKICNFRSSIIALLKQNTTLIVSMTSLCPTKSSQAFNVEAVLKMAKFYLNEFPMHDHRTLRANLENYIIDVSGDEKFNNLKGIANMAKMMVEANKHTINLMVYLLLKLALIFPVATSTVE
uniref:Uncharacterized protein n=1 Tax=Lactuca sativa TaxID=4236 RepID=A0A9R1WM51_LACSA|nr:hypothetical protein LSAT_V11C100039590 [Lactuca sativa]